MTLERDMKRNFCFFIKHLSATSNVRMSISNYKICVITLKASSFSCLSILLDFSSCLSWDVFLLSADSSSCCIESRSFSFWLVSTKHKMHALSNNISTTQKFPMAFNKISSLKRILRWNREEMLTRHPLLEAGVFFPQSAYLSLQPWGRGPRSLILRHTILYWFGSICNKSTCLMCKPCVR